MLLRLAVPTVSRTWPTQQSAPQSLHEGASSVAELHKCTVGCCSHSFSQDSGEFQLIRPKMEVGIQVKAPCDWVGHLVASTHHPTLNRTVSARPSVFPRRPGAESESKEEC